DPRAWARAFHQPPPRRPSRTPLEGCSPPTPPIQLGIACGARRQMPLQFSLFIFLARRGSGQRQQFANGFVFAHARAPSVEPFLSVSRIISRPRRRRVFAVESGTFMTSAISSTFISSSHRSVRISRSLHGSKSI